MKEIISILLLAVSANLDTFVLAVSYELNHIKITMQDGFLIGLITGAFTYFSVGGGALVAKVFTGRLPDILGGLILVLMGIYLCGKWILFESKAREAKKSQPESDTESQEAGKRRLRAREVVFLSCALSINNVGLGMAAGIAKIPALYAAAVTFVITFLCLAGGILTAERLSKTRASDYISLVSGILIIVLGIYECLI